MCSSVRWEASKEVQDAILTPTFFLRKDLMLTTSSTIVDTAIAEHVLLFMLMFSR